MTAKPWPPAWLTPVSDEEIAAGRGDHAIEFVSLVGIITKDSVAGNQGTPLILREWQKELIRNLYASDLNGGLKHRVGLVGMPRKQGKSALASALAVYDLYAGPRGGEVYSIAAEKEQARIVFADAKKIIEANAELSAMAKLYRDAIEIPDTGSIYRVLSAESYSKEGLSPTAVWLDELHAHPNRELFDVMSLAMGARGNKAHLVSITTAGVKTESQTGKDSIAYSLYQYGQRVSRGEQHDPTFFMAWWEAPPEGDYKDPDNWRIASPGIDDICAIEDYESAIRRTPENEFKTKRLNLWTNSQAAWLPTGSWETLATEFEVSPEQEIILAFDGSFSGDASVIVGCTVPEGDEKPQLFLVKAWEKDLNIHDDDWRVDIADVEQTIIRFCQEHPRVREIACDPFRWQRSMEYLEGLGLPIVEWPSTSARRMVPACAKFYDAVVEGRLEHDGNPLLARHINNAVVKTDNLGPRIVKDKRNSARKIDGAVAAVLALDRSTGRLEEQLIPQVYV
jgi:phage terminase large subunit-like protein